MPARGRNGAPEPLDVRTTDVVLTGEPADLLAALRAGAVRAGIADDRVHLVLPGTPLDAGVRVRDNGAGLAVIAIRRNDAGPPFRRALTVAGRVAPLMAPGAVHVVISVSSVTRLAPRLERRLTTEVLHQLELAAAPSERRKPWRGFRMNLGLGALRAAGVRVFRIRVAA